jgi:hypothetical protein
MLAVLSTFSLFSLLIGVALLAPILTSLLRRARAREDSLRRQLQRREDLLREREATISAYREVVALQMNDLESVPLPPLDEQRENALLFEESLASS